MSNSETTLTDNGGVRRHASRKKLAMADRIARFDWASTSVGPIENWPERFRTSVDICLSNPLPAFVWWGPELINIYNDAYAPLLGRKHPSALGQNARKVWASVWPVIAADVDAAMKHSVSVVREHVRFVMKRKGYPDEMFFTYTFGPIPDGYGGVGGVFQVVMSKIQQRPTQWEQTQHTSETRSLLSQVKAGLNESLERWQAVIANMPEGVVICDAEGRLLDWNRAALELNGYADVQDAHFTLAKLAETFEVSDRQDDPLAFAHWPMSRLLRGETVRNHVVRARRRDGENDIVIVCNGTLIRGDNGEVRLALITFRKAINVQPMQSLTKIKLPGIVAPETDEQRAALAAADDVEKMLVSMDLTLNEQAFAKDVGQQLVNHAIDAYMKSSQQNKGFDGSSIAASVAVAMRIVSDAM